MPKRVLCAQELMLQNETNFVILPLNYFIVKKEVKYLDLVFDLEKNESMVFQ